MASTVESTDTKQRSESIGALLEPWVEEFAKYGHARVSYTKPRMGPQVATIEFVLSTLSEGYASRDDVIALREALDVLYIAAQQDVRVVEEALSGLCYHDIEIMLDDDDELTPVSTDAVKKDGDIDVAFVLTFYGAQGRFLEEVIAPHFFANRDSRSDLFASARTTLVGDSHGSIQPLACRVNIVSMDTGFLDGVELDYMERVVAFVHLLDQVATSQRSNNASDAPSMVLTGIDFELNELMITSQTAHAAQRLQQVSIPVSCSRVAIDPRSLSCSSDELASFLDGIGSSTRPMTVEIGHINASKPAASLDADQESLEQLIGTIFCGVVGSVAVSGLSFGPLLSLMGSPSSRKAVWTQFFYCLASSSSTAPLSFVGISPQVQLMEEDAAFIRDAVENAAVDSKRPIQIKSVSLWLCESSPAAVEAFIHAIGANVETLTLQSEPHTPTSSGTVATIVEACPRLTSLSLVSAEIESMAIFMATPTPLVSLSLNSIELKERQSVVTFLTALGDPTSALAKRLTKLHLRTENNAPQQQDLLGLSEAEILDAVLCDNRTLRDLEVTVSEDTPTHVVAKLQRHDRQVLAEPLLLQQKLAFLSAIQCADSDQASSHRARLDQDVAQLICEFAAERVSRRVYVEW